VHGGFFSEEGRAMLVAASAARLNQAVVGNMHVASWVPETSNAGPLLAPARG
jgi:hypothetical protein